MTSIGKVECPECRGEGMMKRCGWHGCLVCKATGEITPEEMDRYLKMKGVTIAELMHPGIRKQDELPSKQT